MTKATGKGEQLMLAILTNVEIAKRAVLALRRNIVLFNQFASPHLHCLMAAYLELVEKHGKLEVPRRQLVAHLQEALDAETAMAQEQRERATSIIQDVIAGEQVATEDGDRFLKFAAEADATSKVSAMLVSGNTDFMALSDRVNKLQQDVDDIVGESDAEDSGGIKIVKPFKEMQRLLKQMPRIPTGINWMDKASSGGGRMGELWLILGGTGGGKTVTAVQYSCLQALLGNQVALFQYEQQIEGDIAERIMSSVTGESLDLIRDKGWEGLPENIRDKFKVAVDEVADNLSTINMSSVARDPADDKSNLGMYDIWQTVKKLNEGKPEDQRVKSVIVDWIGAMVVTIASQTGESISGTDFQHVCKREFLIANRMAREEKLMVIFFQQLTTEAVQKPPTYKPTKNDSENNRAMANDFDIVLCLGKLDANKICWLNPGKTRKTDTQAMTLHLVGDKCRFDLVEGWLPGRDGQFYNPRLIGQEDATERETTASTYRRDVD